MRVVRFIAIWLLPLVLLTFVNTAEPQGSRGSNARSSSVKQPKSTKGKKSSKRNLRSSAKKGAAVEKKTETRKSPPRTPTVVDARRDGVSPVDGRINTIAGGNVERTSMSYRAPPASRNRFVRVFERDELSPTVRRLSFSSRPAEMVAGGALAHGIARGLKENDLIIVPVGDVIRVRNAKGHVLVDLSDERAKSLGGFRVVPELHTGKFTSPSYCRNGEGHPEWGRQWCVQEGHGLGLDEGMQWGRVVDPQNVLFRRTGWSSNLDRSALATLLGSEVIDRLALHAITLGIPEPITGLWIGAGEGPQVLQLLAGLRPIAEIVDRNHDDHADLILIAMKAW
jgi:hypothetical protein